MYCKAKLVNYIFPCLLVLLQAKIELKKKAAGIWIPIPCIDQMGSCSYGDVCLLLNQLPQCPPQLTAIGIDCKCPIKAVSLIV